MIANNQPISESSWLTTKEAARYLGCSKAFLEKDRLDKLSGIPFVKLGRKLVRYNRVDLDSYLSSQQEVHRV